MSCFLFLSSLLFAALLTGGAVGFSTTPFLYEFGAGVEMFAVEIETLYELILLLLAAAVVWFFIEVFVDVVVEVIFFDSREVVVVAVGIEGILRQAQRRAAVEAEAVREALLAAAAEAQNVPGFEVVGRAVLLGFR